MIRVSLDPLLAERPCAACGASLVRRRREAPKLWIGRRFCSCACRGALSIAGRRGRFWARVDRRGADECWPWLGLVTDRGYGQFSTGDKNFRAHRYALATSGVVVPDDRLVMHTCDNPPCCNPAHLRVGTSLDNNQDMRRKGRAKHFVGSETVNATLTADDVRAMRLGVGTLATIAAQFGVSPSTVSRIRARKLWGHVA